MILRSPTHPRNPRPASPVDGRVAYRRRAGMVATISRVVAGEELGRFEVLVTHTTDASIGLRSPIGLARGMVYHLRIGPVSDEHAAQLSVLTSRRRPDGTYDIGAQYVWRAADAAANDESVKAAA